MTVNPTLWVGPLAPQVSQTREPSIPKPRDLVEIRKTGNITIRSRRTRTIPYIHFSKHLSLYAFIENLQAEI